MLHNEVEAGVWRPFSWQWTSFTHIFLTVSSHQELRNVFVAHKKSLLKCLFAHVALITHDATIAISFTAETDFLKKCFNFFSDSSHPNFIAHRFCRFCCVVLSFSQLLLWTHTKDINFVLEVQFKIFKNYNILQLQNWYKCSGWMKYCKWSEFLHIFHVKYFMSNVREGNTDS